MSYARKQFMFQQCEIYTPAVVGEAEPTAVDLMAQAASLQPANKQQWALEVTVKHWQLQIATNQTVEKDYLIQLTISEQRYRIAAPPVKIRGKYRTMPMYNLLLVETG